LRASSPIQTQRREKAAWAGFHSTAEEQSEKNKERGKKKKAPTFINYTINTLAEFSSAQNRAGAEKKKN